MTKNDDAMKKMTKFIFAMAVGTALVLACSKEQEPKQDALSNQVSQEEITLQEGNLVFAATAATLEGSRTTVENGSGNERIVKWAAGDEISVWWSSDGNGIGTATQAGTSSSFSVAGTVSDNYYAGYPASAATALNEGVLTISVPSAQDGTFASANMMAATTTDALRNFVFYNVTGLLKFTVEGSYSSVIFRGAKGEAVVGDLPVSFTASGVSLGEATDAGTAIVASLNGPGTYYISVLPGNFSEGFSATFYDGDGNPSPSVTYNKNVTLTKDIIVNLGTLDERIQSNLFVTPAGAGTKSGRSWDNAMGVSEFRDFVKQPVDGSGTMILAESNYKASRMDGITFHFAQGDYYITGEADAQVKVEFTGYPKQVEATFLGGYPSGLSGKTTTGRDAATYKTNFTGNKESAIFTFGNQVDFAFDGINFKDVKTSNSGLLAVYATAGNTGDLALAFSHCNFADNIQTNKDHTGAAVTIGKGTATFDYCTFSGNEARNGSALNSYPNSTVTVRNSTFSDNSTWNTSGAVQNAGGTLIVDDCLFENNQSGKDSTMYAAGGAFHANADGGCTTTFNRCTFSGNRSKMGGAISMQYATVVCNDCTFSGNTAYKAEGTTPHTVTGKKAGGAIYLSNNNADLTLNNCTFTGNTASYACGGAIYSDKAKKLAINAGTSFSSNEAYMGGGALFANTNFAVNGNSSSSVTFSNNKSTHYYSQYCNGGAVYIEEGTTSTMDYAVFSGNEAGQVSGSEINYSNGGAITMRGVTSFIASHCEFSGNIGRNGGSLNLELGTGSVCRFVDCYFHDHSCTYQNDATKGNFSGSVARIGYGTARFEGCEFTDNMAQHRSAVFHINNKMAHLVCDHCVFNRNYCPATGDWAGGVAGVEHGRADFSVCDFNGNYVNGRGGIATVQNNSILAMDGCIVRGNHSASGGMIRINANCLVMLNRVAFYNNWTTNSGGWGVAIHSGNSHVCMNNVVAYANKTSASSPGNNITFNSDGGWLVVNSTVVDDCVTALFRANSSSRKAVFCNNILVNRKTADNVFHSSIGVFTDNGHNVLSYPVTPSSPSLASTDFIGVTDSSLGGTYTEQFVTEPYYAAYIWNGSLSGFSAATASDVENTLKNSYTDSFTAESGSCNSDISNIGQGFYDWLTSLSPNALTVDVRNVTRTGTMWPGSYQNN